jgi:hypothetical protein
MPKVIPTENPTRGRAALNELDPGVIAAILELNTMDQELYEYAKKRVMELSGNAPAQVDGPRIEGVRALPLC